MSGNAKSYGRDIINFIMTYQVCLKHRNLYSLPSAIHKNVSAPQPCQCLGLSIFLFWAILLQVKDYHIVVMICLMTNGIGHVVIH